MDGVLRLEAVTGGVRHHGCVVETGLISLRAEVDLDGRSYFSFSLNERDFIGLGGAISLSAGFWKGARPGLFTFNRLMNTENMGSARFERFEYDILDWAGY
jgi:hypothetical protein